MAVANAAAAPSATPANTRVTTMSAAEIATLSTQDEDFYSISREHMFANNVICTSVNDPGAPALLHIPKYELHAHVILAMTIDLKDNAVTTILKNSNILTHELRTRDTVCRSGLSPVVGYDTVVGRARGHAKSRVACLCARGRS